MQLIIFLQYISIEKYKYAHHNPQEFTHIYDKLCKKQASTQKALAITLDQFTIAILTELIYLL